MDMQQFEDDAYEALKEFPRGFVQDAVGILSRYDLGKIVPVLMEKCGRHVKAIAFEAAMGQLDKVELEAGLRRVVERFGQEVPAPKVP